MLKGKISGIVLILLLMLAVGIVLLFIGLSAWLFAPNLLPSVLYGTLVFSGLFLLIVVLNFVAIALVKPGPWQKTRKNLLIAVALLITLVAGLILASYGAYYMQVVDLQNGSILLGSGMATLGSFSVAFNYILWKNWYQWESKIRKVLIPMTLAFLLFIVIVIILLMLKVIE